MFVNVGVSLQAQLNRLLRS